MSKKKDSTEALTNVIVGAGINWVLTLIMFNESALFVTGATLVFMFFSYLRSYCIRRIFRGREDS